MRTKTLLLMTGGFLAVSAGLTFEDYSAAR